MAAESFTISPARSAVQPQPCRKRLGVICDFAEERWPSMDWAGEMLLSAFASDDAFQPLAIAPAMHRRAGKAPLIGASRGALNLDRLIARYRDYPRYLRRHAGDCDLFHIADHSYAHLALELPAHRTIVTCHDIDAFRVLLGQQTNRHWLLARIASRLLRGMRRAAIVLCDSVATRDALEQYELLPPERLVVVPLCVHPSFSLRPSDEAAAATREILPLLEGKPFLLHVGSAIPRKRIDILLHVFAAARRLHPHLLLVRVGGELTPAQWRLAVQLGVADALISLPTLDRPTLAAIYGSASLVLLTSESEGFGLPMVEALACGTPVLATDIAVLREAGGDAVRYCALEDIVGWGNAIEQLLRLRHSAEFEAWRIRALAQASRFSVANFAAAVKTVYAQVLAAEEPK